jgi:cytochrome c biogenesis protein CcdA
MEGIFQISLIAAFVAGMVALFAPCCITFLLPAYLGTVFKEKEKILLMTLIFGAGIFIVLMPAVLGIALISQALFRYHDPIYIVGAVVMILVAIASLLGMKSPIMIHLPSRAEGDKAGILSVFTLGIFSGITSACCAPVLIGILTMAFLSPTFFGSLLIGAVYVLGMVVPLLLISLFLSDKVNKLQILKKKLTALKILGRDYIVTVSNFIAFIIFLLAGIFTLVLTLKGQLSMAKSEDFAKIIQNAGGTVNQYVGNSFLLNALFIVAIAFFVYFVSKRIKREVKK